MFNFTISRSSSAIEAINCQLMGGFVLVSYKNGRVYAYKNVSKRAILNLYFNKNISLGFWANTNLINNERVSYTNLDAVVKYYAFPERYFATVWLTNLSTSVLHWFTWGISETVITMDCLSIIKGSNPLYLVGFQ